MHLHDDETKIHPKIHFQKSQKQHTPQKFNMEPEKKSLEKEIPFGNHHFQVPF